MDPALAEAHREFLEWDRARAAPDCTRGPYRIKVAPNERTRKKPRAAVKPLRVVAVDPLRICFCGKAFSRKSMALDCNTCRWKRWRKKNPHARCTDCPKILTRPSGRCPSCQRKHIRATKPPCPCGNKHYMAGKCEWCYKKARLTRDPIAKAKRAARDREKAKRYYWKDPEKYRKRSRDRYRDP